MIAILLLALLSLSSSACLDSCYQCYDTSSFCIACKPNFELSLESTCVSSSVVPHCAFYSNSTHCLTCEPTYTLQNNSCVKQFTGCVNENPSTNECYICSFGTKLVNGACVGAIQCKTQAEQCSGCLSGWALSNGICDDSTGNCLQKSPKGVCKTCKLGYKLIGYQCVADTLSIGDCYIYNPANKCRICKTGYYIKDGYCFVSRQIAMLQSGSITVQTLLQQKNASGSSTASNSSPGLTNPSASSSSSSPSSTSFPSTNQHNSFGDNSQSTSFGTSGQSFPSQQGSKIQQGPSSQNGQTTSQGGMVVINEQQPTTQQPRSDLNCQSWIGFTCSQCFPFYYASSQTGKCEAVSSLCLDYNRQNGWCTSCWPGYSLNQQTGACVQQNKSNQQGQSTSTQTNTQANPNPQNPSSSGSQINTNTQTNTNSTTQQQISDQNCQTWSGPVCSQCFPFYYISPQTRRCTAVSSLCMDYNQQNGYCTSCWPGYTLNQQTGACLQQTGNQGQGPPNSQSSQQNQSSQGQNTSQQQNDLNCHTWNDLTCMQCFSFFYIAPNGKCVAVSSLCKDYNKTNGWCISCWPGYDLNKTIGACVQQNRAQSNTQNNTNSSQPTTTNTNSPTSNNQQTDSNCQQFNGNTCVSCFNFYYVSPQTGKCTAVSSLCMDYNRQNGWCTSCWPGYTLNQQTGSCFQQNQTNTNNNSQTSTNNNQQNQQNDQNCQTWNGAVCSQCYAFFYVSPQTGRCAAVSSLCMDYNRQNGWCTSCWPGYTLNQQTGACIQQNQGQGSTSGNNQTNANSSSNTNTTSQTNSITTIANCLYGNPQAPFNCLQCASGYTPVGQTCQIVSPLCSTYNPSTGDCYTCKYGLALTGSQCIDSNCLNTFNGQCTSCRQGYTLNNSIFICQQNSHTISYCLMLGVDGRCQQCESGYFVTAQGICHPLPANCLYANIQTISCIQCKQGYTLNQQEMCVLLTVYLPNCAQISSSGDCQQCVQGYTPNYGACILSTRIANCQSYDNQLGQCLICAAGYSLNQSSYLCALTSNGNNNGGSNSDPNCLQSSGGACIRCSLRYYYSQADLKCLPVNPLCNSYNNQSGQCTTCYPGYSLKQGACIVGGSSSNCQNLTNGVCQQCFQGYYLSQGQCQPLNPLCNTSNLNNGQCISCYTGYTLINGQCLVSRGDPNCLKSNSNGVCLQCSESYYISNGRCMQVSPLCNGHNPNGNCLGCYPGYMLSQGSCVIASGSANCLQYSNGVCTKCFSGYYLNYQQQCLQVNPLCKTYDQTGACLSCYVGYSLSGQGCIISQTGGTGQNNCKTTNLNNVCTACYEGYYLNSSSQCVRVDDLCKTRNSNNNQCTSCYSGYELTSIGTCQVSSTGGSSQSRDPYCISFNGNICIQCAMGYYISNTGRCTLANPLCKAINQQGQCTDCYTGYSLSQGNCIILSVTIPFCQTMSGSVCSECIQGYYLNQGGCKPVSILCSTYNRQTGACLSCISGYIFQQGRCILPALGADPNCRSYSSAYCSECNQGYFLSQYWCTALDSNCLQFNFTSNRCLSCRNGLTANGAYCQ